jgi:hypothetical protein
MPVAADACQKALKTAEGKLLTSKIAIRLLQRENIRLNRNRDPAAILMPFQRRSIYSNGKSSE